MKNINKKILIIIFMISNINTIHSENRKFIGYAYDIKTNKLLYTENHLEIYSNGKHIKTILEYRNPDNILIAKKISDYTHSEFIPDFELSDYRNGYGEGCIKEKNGFKLFNIENNNKRFSSLFSLQQNVVVDSGFHKFIQKNFQELQDNKTLYIEFGVPSRLTILSFKVYKVKEINKENQNLIRFAFEISNPLFRLLLSPIYVDYDINTKDLIQYTGISNLYDKNNKAYNVKIIFKY